MKGDGMNRYICKVRHNLSKQTEFMCVWATDISELIQILTNMNTTLISIRGGRM